MYIVCIQIANWLLMTVVTPQTAQRHSVKPENTSEANKNLPHHRHHATECLYQELNTNSWCLYYELFRQSKAGRERSTPDQSKDPSPTLPTYRQK